MVFAINCGHCLSGYDTGAQGNGYKEENLTRLVGNKVIAKLRAQGHIVIDCTVDFASSVNNALNSIVTKANAIKVDMFISIHFNGSDTKGHGVEVFTYGAREIKEARNILNNIVALGYINRGIKDGKGLAVIKNTNAPAMLVECCFIDNKADMQKFDVEKMANAIIKGLTEKEVLPIAQNDIQKRYCLEFQKWYNATTKTTTPILENGEWNESTESSYKILGRLLGGTY